VTDDLGAVAPLVVALANRYTEYENDGETVSGGVILARFFAA
tara:strand:+ start:934 stop:1059 length:126 start_codon:yes stop_codon:yes gene_type:complete